MSKTIEIAMTYSAEQWTEIENVLIHAAMEELDNVEVDRERSRFLKRVAYRIHNKIEEETGL